MNQMSSDHSKLRTVLISKLGLHTDRFQRDNQITEAVEKLITERDNALERATNVTGYEDGMREAMQRIARACDKTFAVDIGYDNLPELVEELVARPDTTQPQLSEIRYVLHGDIQPCSVLYSDETTTLLRLDEGDIMCETDTIEWSDSVTYRCQELLKSESVRKDMVFVKHATPVLAQLVRDERILLNDSGGDELGAEEAYFRVETAPVIVPCPPAPASFPTCGNPYVHDSAEYPEVDMRKAGWLTEDLVQMGYGHYAPVQSIQVDTLN